MKNKIAVAGALSLSLASAGVVLSGTNPTSIRQMLLNTPVTDQLGGGTTRPVASQNAFEFQAPNAPREHQRPFSFGNRLFNTNWVEAPASVKSFDGVGPLFNRASCSGCHTKDGRGSPPASGIGPMDQVLFRISVPGIGEHGGPRPSTVYGAQLSERANLGIAPEGQAKITYTEVGGRYGDNMVFSLRHPIYQISNPGYGPLPANLMISPRVAPQMIGLGLLESVPSETLMALADPDDTDGDGVSGRPNIVWNTATQSEDLGRFGWKAGQPDLRNQSAGAALGDIGLTTSLHAEQNCAPSQTACKAAIEGGTPELSDEYLQKLTLYVQTLAVPAQRDSADESVMVGAKIFRTIGCAACHMPTLKSGSANVPEIANQTFHPYTDLLLHDLGDGLADGRPDFAATANEWRTPPLWGLGLVPTVNGHNTLLHDGRARGFAEAILWHGREAEKSKEKFRTAPETQREALIAFLKSL